MPTTTRKKSTARKIAKKVATKPATKPATKSASKSASKSATKAATKAATKSATKSETKLALPAAALVAVGTKAPDFTLADAKGKLVTLSAFKGKPVVVYFYPKDDTSGCTQEACDFRDNLPQFGRLGCTVLGISPDSVGSHAKFAAKHGLTVTLLADEPEAEAAAPAVCTAYGVWQEKSMYGRAYMGVVRTTYVIDRAGKVAHRFDKVSVTGHVAEVLSAVKSLA